MSGYYLLHRGWMDNPAFNNEPFSRRDAWIWMIETANFAAGTWGAKGKTVRLERGQFCRSIRDMAAAWKWDRSKVSRFMARLVSDNMIRYSADDGVCLVTVCNYDKYQPKRDSGETATETTPRQKRDNTETQIKEGNEGNKGEGRDLTVDPTDQPSESGLAVGQPANDNPPEKPAKQKRGTRVPDGELPEEWAVAANHSREEHGMPLLGRRVLALRWSAFQDYWRGVIGSKGLKADWLATWRNDCRDPRTEKRFPPAPAPAANANGPPPTEKRGTIKDLDNIPLFFDKPTKA